MMGKLNIYENMMLINEVQSNSMQVAPFEFSTLSSISNLSGLMVIKY
jgi:hypothetical protein